MRRAGERRLRVLALLGGRGDSELETKRLCEVCAEATSMSGAGIMLMSGDAPRGSICTTNDVSSLIEQLQYTLGEGPCMDAYHQDRPVLEPDLAHPNTPRWHAFTGPAIKAGVRAIFGFPLQVGAVRLGALNLYSDQAGPLSDNQHADALVVADVAAQTVLMLQANAPPGSVAVELEAGADFQIAVHQATGMIAAQLEATVGHALIRLRAHAFRTDRPLAEVARDVVARNLRLDSQSNKDFEARAPFPLQVATPQNTFTQGPHSRYVIPRMAGTDLTGDPMPREAILAGTLVKLADTLVPDFDVVELLTVLTDRCVEVLEVGAAGLMLVAPEGDLRVMASSSETMRVLELFELQSQEGPCLDCYRTGQPVANQDLTGADDRWPRFSLEALAAGFHSVHALPMRLRGAVIGALNLFHLEPGEMRKADLDAAQALADVATIAILQHRAVIEAQVLNEQLNHALNSRIVIEQAKGMIAEREGLNMEQAFARLRNHARNHNLRLVSVAREVIGGTLAASALDRPVTVKTS